MVNQKEGININKEKTNALKSIVNGLFSSLPRHFIKMIYLPAFINFLVNNF